MGHDAPVDVVTSRQSGDRGAKRAQRRIRLRVSAIVLLTAVTAAACGTAAAKPDAVGRASRAASAAATPSRPATPSPSATPKRHRRHKAAAAASPSAQAAPPPSAPKPTGPVVAAGCQDTFVPAYFYASSDWAQAIGTRPAPGVMLLNVDNGVGTSPLSHFQTLVRQAQAAGITVLGYSSTEYGARSISSVEAEVRDYKAWYGVNGIFLDLTEGTSGALPYYQQLASYIRGDISGAVIWLNVGAYPDQSFMSVANTVMVFEGSYASYVADQVPGWVSQYSPSHFANVIYETPQSDLVSAVNLSRSRSRAGFLFVTDLSGSGNPYGAMPSYWSQEAATIGHC